MSLSVSVCIYRFISTFLLFTVSVCVFSALLAIYTSISNRHSHVVIIGNNRFIVYFALVVAAVAGASVCRCFVLKPQEKSYHRI